MKDANAPDLKVAHVRIKGSAKQLLFNFAVTDLLARNWLPEDAGCVLHRGGAKLRVELSEQAPANNLVHLFEDGDCVHFENTPDLYQKIHAYAREFPQLASVDPSVVARFGALAA